MQIGLHNIIISALMQDGYGNSQIGVMLRTCIDSMPHTKTLSLLSTPTIRRSSETVVICNMGELEVDHRSDYNRAHQRLELEEENFPCRNGIMCTSRS